MKNGILKGKGLDLGAEPPCINFVGYPLPPIIKVCSYAINNEGGIGIFSFAVLAIF